MEKLFFSETSLQNKSKNIQGFYLSYIHEQNIFSLVNKSLKKMEKQQWYILIFIIFVFIIYINLWSILFSY